MLVLHVVYFVPAVNSSAVQDCYFPGLSRSWKIREKIPDFPEDMGTL